MKQHLLCLSVLIERRRLDRRPWPKPMGRMRSGPPTTQQEALTLTEGARTASYATRLGISTENFCERGLSCSRTPLLFSGYRGFGGHPLPPRHNLGEIGAWCCAVASSRSRQERTYYLRTN